MWKVSACPQCDKDTLAEDKHGVYCKACDYNNAAGDLELSPRESKRCTVQT